MEIAPVGSDERRSTLGVLLTEYHEWMAEHADEYDARSAVAGDLHSLDREPGSWAWIARSGGEPAGCVLLYDQTDEVAELKRLYVKPDSRGGGIGRALTRTAVDHARSRGYGTLGLTTPPWSERAHALYESMGFERTPPYPETRLPERYHDEAIFMRLDLSATGTTDTCPSG